MDSALILRELDACLSQAMLRGLGKKGLSLTIDKSALTDAESIAICERLERFFAMINEANRGAEALAYGNLDLYASRDNVFAMPYKALSASLRHLTWQTAQVAAGDLRHEVHFLGEFSTGFNRMVAALKENKAVERRQKAILDAVEEGIYLVDGSGALLFMNQAAERLLEYRLSDLAGTVIHDLIVPAYTTVEAQRSASLLAAAVAAGDEYRSDEVIFLSKSGTRLPASLTCRPIQEDEAYLGAVISFRDLTAKRVPLSQLGTACTEES